ncbi:MAG: 1-phosphofructokinase [Clostridiales bacterium]|nr:1-phosphofructokinase [Clostridiales bacterium]
MIYTVTFNPSLDYYVKVNNVKHGFVNRTSNERLAVGGKGINVSLALKELGEETLALGFVAGFTGNYIREKVTELGLNFDFINVEGQSRINVKIKGNTETDINGTGAPVTQKDVNKLVRKLKNNLKEGDWLAVCGSVPPTLPTTTYADIFKKLKNIPNINLVVDTNGKLLTETLKYRPFLIKPNIYELCEVFNLTTMPDIEGIFAHARRLQEMGARNVIVSLGSSGAAMVTETSQSIYVRAARGELVNSVGAGDSMVAGFIHEYINSGNYFSALNYATAAGSACAFTKNLANRAQIEYVESLML